MSSPIPILYIHHESALGGAPLSLLYLLQKLDRQKYTPTIFCLKEGPAAELYRKNNFHVEVVPGPDLSHTELIWFRWWQIHKIIYRLLFSVILFFRLRKSLKQLNPKPRLLHLNSSTLVTAALAAKSLNLPVIWHIREPLSPGYFGIRRSILRHFINQLADHVIAISNYDADQLGPKIDGKKVSVIHNFIDFSLFDQNMAQGQIRKELGISSSAFIVLFLGGSAYVKGAYILLNAIPRILENVPNAIFIVAGETDSTFQLEASQSLQNRRDRLHLVGPRHDVPALLRDSNVLVFPSTVPHFARPVIEAAAMAKPVVVSDLGGVRELVIKNETGILVPCRDPLALSQGIIEIAKDEALAFRLGQQALARAKEKFDAHRNSTMTFSVYQAVLNRTS